MTEPRTLEALWDLEDIRQLKYRYLRGVDHHDWDLLAGTLTEDAEASYGGGAIELSGRDAIVEFLSASMGNPETLTAHRVTHPELEFVGPDEVHGRWALTDVVINTKHQMNVQGAAHYEDRYVRTPDGWRIAATRYKRMYEEILPRTSIEGLRLSAEWWATDGRSKLKL